MLHGAWASSSVVVLRFSMLHGVYLLVVYKKLNKNILSTTRSIQFSLFPLFYRPQHALKAVQVRFAFPTNMLPSILLAAM
jgi:hypothetical protein